VSKSKTLQMTKGKKIALARHLAATGLVIIYSVFRKLELRVIQDEKHVKLTSLKMVES